MKKIASILTTLIILGLFIPGLNAQEKKEQLWYGWKETVKTEKVDEYKKLSKELIEICKKEKFPFAFYTWTIKSNTYELWTPISSHSDIEKINDAWMKIIEKWGEEKYAAFNDTRLYSRKFTCTIRNDLRYTPVDPDYGRNEFAFALWVEVYPKSGKQKEFEDAVNWLNRERVKKEYGSYVFYASGGFGYEDPCYVIMIANTTEQEYLKADKQISKAMKVEMEKYYDKINPLLRKSSLEYNWYFLSDLSYEPAKDYIPDRD